MCVIIQCRMLAYRAEDISERLEPQELYDRQEFEESIQFDVRELSLSSGGNHTCVCVCVCVCRLLKSVF